LNILLGKDKEAKIGDFGAASRVEQNSERTETQEDKF
jgi:serine/threonine protein kinase